MYKLTHKTEFKAHTDYNKLKLQEELIYAQKDTIDLQNELLQYQHKKDILRQD